MYTIPYPYRGRVGHKAEFLVDAELCWTQEENGPLQGNYYSGRRRKMGLSRVIIIATGHDHGSGMNKDESFGFGETASSKLCNL